MKCIVEECGEKSTGTVGSKDEYALCGAHRKAWSYYHSGYLDKHYGNYDRHGRLNKKLWNEAMKGFLEHCRIEIVALAEIAEAVARDIGKVPEENKYDNWLAIMRIPAEVSTLELSVLASRLGIDMDTISSKHFDELFDDLLKRVKEKGIIQEES